MRQISLTHGKYTIVDSADYGRLIEYKWHATGGVVKGWYARTARGVKGSPIQMQHMIIESPKGLTIDHVNGNGLDNRKQNLRICTRAENLRNRKLNCNNTSGYKGVSWDKERRKWRVNITVNNKFMYVGIFFCLMKAADAYDFAALKYHGKFAKLNQVNY